MHGLMKDVRLKLVTNSFPQCSLYKPVLMGTFKKWHASMHKESDLHAE
jgi:hypothetical protein